MAHVDALTPLTALSPLDGRYRGKIAALAKLFSEYGLIRERVKVELAWLEALSDEPGIVEFPPLSASARALLSPVADEFAVAEAERVKAIERTTNHDVKAIEYWLRERFAGNEEIKRAIAFIHFACTSEDINNLAYGRMLETARCDILLPALKGLIADLR